MNQLESKPEIRPESTRSNLLPANLPAADAGIAAFSFCYRAEERKTSPSFDALLRTTEGYGSRTLSSPDREARREQLRCFVVDMLADLPQYRIEVVEKSIHILRHTPVWGYVVTHPSGNTCIIKQLDGNANVEHGHHISIDLMRSGHRGSIVERVRDFSSALFDWDNSTESRLLLQLYNGIEREWCRRNAKREPGSERYQSFVSDLVVALAHQASKEAGDSWFVRAGSLPLGVQIKNALTVIRDGELPYLMSLEWTASDTGRICDMRLPQYTFHTEFLFQLPRCEPGKIALWIEQEPASHKLHDPTRVRSRYLVTIGDSEVQGELDPRLARTVYGALESKITSASPSISHRSLRCSRLLSGDLKELMAGPDARIFWEAKSDWNQQLPPITYAKERYNPADEDDDED